MATSGQLVGAFFRGHPGYRGGLRGESGVAIEARRKAGLGMVSGFSERSACCDPTYIVTWWCLRQKSPPAGEPGPLALEEDQIRCAKPKSQPGVWRRRESPGGRESLSTATGASR